MRAAPGHMNDTTGGVWSGAFKTLRTAHVRSWLLQILLVVAIGGGLYFLVSNVVDNLARRNMTSGFGFLARTAGFDIEQSPIAWSHTDTFGRALLVGVCNTLLAAFATGIMATTIGFVVAMMRLSSNWLLRTTAAAYVEFFRNTPAILQIVFWYFAILAPLPPPRKSLALADAVFLNVRGLFVPKPVIGDGGLAIGLSLVLAVAAVLIILFASRRLHWRPTIKTVCVMMLAALLAFAVVIGTSVSWEVPKLHGFNFSGGIRIFPEFIALTLGLSIYTGAFISEIIRLGFVSVRRGVIEAAQSLGLSKFRTLTLVTLPLAVRVIIPPLAGQYVSMVKNTSLAVVIGFPDLVQVFSGTVLNQSGQAIEVMAITMLIYLCFSLSISAVMNWYNARVALVER